VVVLVVVAVVFDADELIFKFFGVIKLMAVELLDIAHLIGPTVHGNKCELQAGVGPVAKSNVYCGYLQVDFFPLTCV